MNAEDADGEVLNSSAFFAFICGLYSPSLDPYVAVLLKSGGNRRRTQKTLMGKQ